MTRSLFGLLLLAASSTLSAQSSRSASSPEATLVPIQSVEIRLRSPTFHDAGGTMYRLTDGWYVNGQNRFRVREGVIEQVVLPELSPRAIRVARLQREGRALLFTLNPGDPAVQRGDRLTLSEGHYRGPRRARTVWAGVRVDEKGGIVQVQGLDAYPTTVVRATLPDSSELRKRAAERERERRPAPKPSAAPPLQWDSPLLSSIEIDDLKVVPRFLLVFVRWSAAGPASHYTLTGELLIDGHTVSTVTHTPLKSTSGGLEKLELPPYCGLEPGADYTLKLTFNGILPLHQIERTLSYAETCYNPDGG